MKKIFNYLKYGIARKIKTEVFYRIKTFQDLSKKREIIKNYKNSPRYLNVGGCDLVRPNWRSLDYVTPHYNYNLTLVDFNINLEEKKTWPIETGSYDLVYTSHALEHLSQEAADFTLLEMYRILKKGGGLRIAVPDIDLFLDHYAGRDEEWFQIHFPKARWETDHQKRKGDYQMEYVLIGYFAASLVGEVSKEEVRKDFYSMDRVSFLEKYRKRAVGQNHRNWYNFEKLNRLLGKTGFSKITRSQHRQSIFTEFCYRGIDERAKELSIYMDAVK